MLPPFGKSVFINCPFDEEFAPILQAISFCVVFLGFYPRLSPQNADNAAGRLDRIIDLVEGSKYAIHDLSRCKSSRVGEFARLNMPFELGIDYGCKKFGLPKLAGKSMLILEGSQFDYQKALSDISGWDIQFHQGNYQEAIRIVRNWLVLNAGANAVGPSRIHGKYIAFQEWYWERQLAAGSSEDDIKAYPTVSVVGAMQEWMDAGQPT